MRRRIFTAAISVVFLLATCAVFTGCNDIDPPEMVKTNLELINTGKITDETLEQFDQSEEELKKVYEDSMKKSIDMFFENDALDGFDTEEARDKMYTAFEKLYSNVKFEVSEDYTEEDGAYFVDVTVYPMEVWDEAYAYVEDKASNGEYTYTSEEQLAKEIYNDLFDYIIEHADKPVYTDPVTVKAKIAKDEDGKYSITDESLQEIDNAYFVQ